MNTFRSAGLLLFAALGLPAATLTVGTAAIAPGQTGTVTVALVSAGASIAGLQFDLTYDPTVFTVLNVSVGSAATAALKPVLIDWTGSPAHSTT